MKVENKVELFLDSGAFSAWTQKVEIDIQSYIQFIKENIDCISVYANLDVIGDVEKTWENQMIMEEAGLSPIPVFHAYFEDPKWLKRYMDRGYEYIALGGMAGGAITVQALRPVLDRLWRQHLSDADGLPLCKVHGFGLTSLPLMLRYPWYSVDSTSWVITGRMGGIFMPRWYQGKWVYDDASWKISVSNRSPDKKEAGQHIETLSPGRKEIVLRYIEEKGYRLGKSEFKKVDQSHVLQENERWAEKKPSNKYDKRELEIITEPGISNKYQLRDEMNIIYFLDLEKSMPEWPWAFKVKETQHGFKF